MFFRKLSQSLTCLLVAAALITVTAVSVEAKGKKKRTLASTVKGKSTKQIKLARSSSSRRSLARKGKRGRRAASRYAQESYRPDPSPAVVPDHIEVLEYGATNSADLSKWLNPPRPSTQSGGDAGTITPSRRVNIDVMRVIQIQQALASKGFYSGETSGNYDDATMDAMRRFQASNKIAATGYPTAHALKRLGLASW